MLKQITKSLAVALAAVILVCLGVLAGGRLQEGHQQQVEVRSETTKRVAVVNLDGGIEINGKMNYYAQNMIVLPNNNFVMTNLEDARSGIKNGSYAAYIIVPVSFSQSVESINGRPVKIDLEYELNKYLHTPLRAEVVEQLHEFQMTLSENATYIYVSAILKEYHTAQDSSQKVLQNGENNIKAVKNISVDNLFMSLQYPELNVPDFVRADLDVEKYLQAHSGFSKSMDYKFKENLMLGEDGFEYVKTDYDEVQSEMERLTAQMSDITISRDTYSTGIQELFSLIDTHSLDQQSKRNWIRAELATHSDATVENNQQYADAALAAILAAIQGASDTYLDSAHQQIQEMVDQGISDFQEENQQIVNDQLGRLQASHDEAYTELQDYIDIRLNEIALCYEEQANNYLEEYISNVRNQLILPEDESDYSEIDEALSSMIATFSDARIEFATSSDAWIEIEDQRENFPSLATSSIPLRRAVPAAQEEKNALTEFWLEIPVISFTVSVYEILLPDADASGYDSMIDRLETFYRISTEDIENTLTRNVIGAIENQLDVDTLDLLRVFEEFESSAESYQKSLEEYDPYEYIDMSFMTQATNDIDKNLYDLQKSFSDKSREEEALVSEIYRAARDNTGELQDVMGTTYDFSKENVVKVVQELRNYQEENYTEDSELLTAFSKQLSYTRVGSLGNKSVYDFISNPVLLTSKGTAEPDGFSFLETDSDYRMWTVMAIVVLGVIAAIMMVIYAICRMKEKR